MTGFSNPVVGGMSNLIRAAIQSPNFVHAVSGWTINKDGSAEFNNLIVRGEFDGTNFIINNFGAFFYSGTPAANNLIASIANNGGTDTFGNAYLPGIVTYFTGASAFAVQLNVGLLAYYISTTNEVGPWTQYFSISVTNPGIIDLLVQNFLVANAQFNIGCKLNVQQLLTANSFNIFGAVAQSTPAVGANLQTDSSHNLNITGDGLGSNHLLIFNYDLALRTAVTPSAPASGIRITADASGNTVITPAAANLTKLTNSQLWLPTSLPFVAPATGMLIGADAAAGDRLQVMPPQSGQWNASLVRTSTFPANSIGGTVLSNLTSGQINANDAQIGATYEIECNGNYTQATTTGTTLQFATKLGGVLGATQTIAAANVAAPGGTGRFIARARVTCIGPLGASCVWAAELMVILTANAAPGTSPAFCDCSAAAGITVDSTINESLQLQAAWGSGVNNPNITSRVSTFKRVN